MVRKNKKLNKMPAYTLKKSARAKRMRVAVYCDCSVVVTAPQDVSVSVIEKFLGTRLEWVQKKIDFFAQKSVDKNITTQSQDHYLEHRGKALKLIRHRVQFFAKRYDFEYGEIKVKKLKTKWGSCSSKKNLNFNYKILFLSAKARDYVIVHELCHLREMNHSEKFWREVDNILPDYRVIKNEMRNL